MLYELISEFAKWISWADESQINEGRCDLSYDSLLVNISIGCEVKIKEVFDIDEGRFVDINELNMNVPLFLEITTKLLNNKKEELQTL